jgi:hypothetical protein
VGGVDLYTKMPNTSRPKAPEKKLKKWFKIVYNPGHILLVATPRMTLGNGNGMV